MFKGMFDLSKVKKKPTVEKGTVHADATPVLSPESLLSTEKRQQHLQDIRDLLSLPEEEYNRVFLPVIHNFAAFVQNLPETERSFFSSLGGMLDHALERTALSLFLCRTYLLPDNSDLSSLSEEELIWVYAVFTASLLLDVGKIVTRHAVTLTDDTGAALRCWLPYSGPMIGQSSHYVFGFIEENYDHMRHLVTPLLARQILPIGEISGGTGDHKNYGGFNWLASDHDVLESWLAMLADEHRQVGSILTVIPLADAQVLESYFTDMKVARKLLPPQTIALLHKLNKERKELQKKQKEFKEKILANDTEKAEKLEKSAKAKQSLFGYPVTTAEQTPLNLSAADIKNIGHQFMSWMKQGTENKSISVGQQNTQVPIAGNQALITPTVMQQFLNESKILPVSNLTVNDLKTALQDAGILRPIAAYEMAQWPALGASVAQSLVVSSPTLALGMGLGQAVAPPPAAHAAMQALPTNTQTAQESYAAQQKKAEHQQQHIRPDSPKTGPGHR